MAAWTDNPATSSTHIRKIHIDELRSAVDANRSAASLPGYAWTDNPISTGTRIRAVHFGEVRSATQALWYCKQMGPIPNWTVGSPPAPTRQISARDINDLRNWVDQYENNPGIPDPQGIVSFCYDPDLPAVISPAWRQDAANLKPSFPNLLIRTVIRARQRDNNVLAPEIIQGYRDGIATWAGGGYNGSVGGVIGAEFDQVGVPNVVPDPSNPLTSAYIDDFPSRAEQFAQQLAPSGLQTYWVWNEPNLPPPPQAASLDPRVFGAMLYQTCSLIKAGAASVGVRNVATYAGALSITPDNDPNFGANAATYLRSMYQYLNVHGVGGKDNPTRPYP